MHLPLLPASPPSQIESALRPPPTPASLTALTCTMAWSGAMRDSGDGHGQPNTSFVFTHAFQGSALYPDPALHGGRFLPRMDWQCSAVQCAGPFLLPASIFFGGSQGQSSQSVGTKRTFVGFFTDDKAERCRTAVLKSTLSPRVLLSRGIRKHYGNTSSGWCAHRHMTGRRGKKKKILHVPLRRAGSNANLVILPPRTPLSRTAVGLDVDWGGEGRGGTGARSCRVLSLSRPSFVGRQRRDPILQLTTSCF